MSLRMLIVIVLTHSCAVGYAVAQETIQPNPKAVRLREIWRASDSTRNQGQYGLAVNVLPGIGPTGVSFVAYGSGMWFVWSVDSVGGITQTWRTTRRSSAAAPFVIRGLLGGRDALAVPWSFDSATDQFHAVDFHAIDSGKIADTPAVRWQSVHLPRPYLHLYRVFFRAADLDLDDKDEFILSTASQHRTDGTTVGELWIYRGGERSRLDSPSVILHSRHGYYWRPAVAQLDSDRFPDLVLFSNNGEATPVKTLWGTGELPSPDVPWQDLDVGTGYAGERRIARIDSDQAEDLIGFEQINDSTVIYRFYLTGSGKAPRSRMYGDGDFDAEWRLRAPAMPVGNAGSVADSTGRMQMLGLIGPRDLVPALMLFGGDGRGVDSRYEAWCPGEFMPVFGGNLDANDDGWVDLLAGNPLANFNNGLVVILAGGPYIPRDSLPAGAIRDLAAEGHRAALSAWPNPATTEVNVAWRGDLRRMPARIEAHDLLGRCVGEGSVDPRVGAAHWDCGTLPRGHYRLTVLDAQGGVIASAPVVLR